MHFSTLPRERAARDPRGPASADEHEGRAPVSHRRGSPATYRLPAGLVTVGEVPENPVCTIGTPEPGGRIALSAN